MRKILLVSALIAHASVLVYAGTLKFADASEYLNLLQSMQDVSSSASVETGRTDAAEVEGNDDVDKDEDTNWSNAGCCLPYVWQGKVILWNGVERSTLYGFSDYPGRRWATYSVTPAFTGFIGRGTDDGKYFDMYVFNKTTCAHHRTDYGMIPTCLPKSAKHTEPFQLGPSVYGRYGLVAQAWFIGNEQAAEQITLRRRDCAPVQASFSFRGDTNLYVEYFADVKTYIEYPQVFDLPAVCCKPIAAEFGLKELQKMNLVGNSIISTFGLEH